MKTSTRNGKFHEPERSTINAISPLKNFKFFISLVFMRMSRTGAMQLKISRTGAALRFAPVHFEHCLLYYSVRVYFV